MNWINKKITCREVGISGRGMFASEVIEAGEVVAYFGGEIIPIEDFYLLPEAVQHFPYQISDDFLFGPASESAISSTDCWNHCCDGNCGFSDSIRLVAMRVIEVGEELTFDYATCMSCSIVDMECNCESFNCRGKVSADDWKMPAIQKKYKGFFQPYLKEKIAKLLLSE